MGILVVKVQQSTYLLLTCTSSSLVSVPLHSTFHTTTPQKNGTYRPATTSPSAHTSMSSQNQTANGDTPQTGSATPSHGTNPGTAAPATMNGSAEHSAQPPSSVRDLPPEALALAAKLFDMARQGETATLEAYLNAGLPANLTNATGDTLLMLAAYHDRPETVAALLGRGADPNALNDKGQSPLAGAIFKGHVNVVRTLVQQGKADVRAGKPNAVECAAMFKRWEEAEIMGTLDECKELSPRLNPVGSRDG